MASLNNVCEWSEHGWKKVTAEEAARKHPGGTVSAQSRLFMCELCGQYVILTDGDKCKPYFKHSANEKNKNCPERILYTFSYDAKEHELPIKLIIETKIGFRLELGLLYIPEDILNKQTSKNVTVKAANGETFIFPLEWLNSETITYLPIGSKPSHKYTIDAAYELLKYWPKELRGISGEGAVFDCCTGKMLSLDADVQVNKKYYLLTSRFYCFNKDYSSMKMSLMCNKKIDNRLTWYVYKIEATILDQEAARFFLNFHCRLTDKPLEIRPIWPIHIEMPYAIKHNNDEMIIHLAGIRQITAKTFPEIDVKSIQCPKNGKVIKVKCNEYQQLISTGSANVLQYLYFWKKVLNNTTPEPSAEVKDGKDLILNSGEQKKLPEGAAIKIKVPFDGTAVLLMSGIITEKLSLPAGKLIIIRNIRYGMSIRILQGLDIVWQASYTKSKKLCTDNDISLYSQLNHLEGAEIFVSHALGAIVTKLRNYPKTTQWIRTAVNRNHMSEKAVKYLRKYIIELSRQRKEES